jgi:plasmid replication initiation protein
MHRRRPAALAPRRLRPYDCLRQLLRHTGGKDYRELANAVRRLYMTTVITNIRTEAGGERPFRWLANA